MTALPVLRIRRDATNGSRAGAGWPDDRAHHIGKLAPKVQQEARRRRASPPCAFSIPRPRTLIGREHRAVARAEQSEQRFESAAVVARLFALPPPHGLVAGNAVFFGCLL